MSHSRSMKPVKFQNPNRTCNKLKCIGWDDTEVLMKLFYQDVSTHSVNLFIDP